MNLLKIHRIFLYFAELPARLRVNEPNLRFVQVAQKFSQNLVQNYILTFSLKYGIIYLSRGQGNGHRTTMSTENRNKKIEKFLKKHLTKYQ